MRREAHHNTIGVTNYGFAKKKNITGQGTAATLGKYASRGSHARGVQQLRKPDHAAPGLHQVRILQGKADPQAGRNVVSRK